LQAECQIRGKAIADIPKFLRVWKIWGLANPDAFAVAPGFESVNLKASVRQFVN
jgi:hypothetical protein